MDTADIIRPQSVPPCVHTRSESRVFLVDGIVESAAALRETYARGPSAGVCVSDGFGVRIFVERGALIISDGVWTAR